MISTCHCNIFKPCREGYGSYWSRGWVFSVCEDVCYDYRAVRAKFCNDENEDAFRDKYMLDIENDPTWKLRCATAPWLSERGSNTEYGVFCDLCPDCSTQDTLVPRTLQEARQGGNYWSVDYPNPMQIPFMLVEDLVEHKRIEHRVVEIADV